MRPSMPGTSLLFKKPVNYLSGLSQNLSGVYHCFFISLRSSSDVWVPLCPTLKGNVAIIITAHGIKYTIVNICMTRADCGLPSVARPARLAALYRLLFFWLVFFRRLSVPLNYIYNIFFNFYRFTTTTSLNLATLFRGCELRMTTHLRQQSKHINLIAFDV